MTNPQLFVVDLHSKDFKANAGLQGLRLVFFQDRLCRTFFGLHEEPKRDDYLKKVFPNAEFFPGKPKHRALAKFILKDFSKRDFFARHGKHFYFGGTDFQKAVWQQIARVSFGCASNYSQLSEKIGRPKATRAVGSACGKNPIPFFVPCHRILAKGGGLGGFSGGLPLKKNLLQFEHLL